MITPRSKNTIGLLFLTFFGIANSEIIKRSEYLDSNNRYLVEWEVDLETKIAIFTVNLKVSRGWVGFGISGGPSMAGADIVIGGVENSGDTYFKDYYSTGNGQIEDDAVQNWELLEASEDTATGTTLKFTRVLNTCDDQDVPITEDTQYLIWAFDLDDTIGYHTNNANRRGAKALNLLDPPAPEVDISKFEKWSIQSTVEMPAGDTTYWCSIHRSPDFNNVPRHVVGFNTKLETDREKQHTHHLAVHKCTPPPGSSAEETFQQYVDHPGDDCNAVDIKIPREYCQTSTLYIWAVGSQMLFLPDVAGYPMGRVDGPEYVMLEVHYDNPGQEANIQIKTEVEVYHTSKLRQFDASVLSIGHSVNYLQTIPPRAESFVTTGHCDPSCTPDKPGGVGQVCRALKQVQTGGFQIFNAMLHSHKAGRKIKVRHFRGNEELPWLAVDNHYRFDFQANRPLKEEILFLPGDQLTVECTYDTSDRDGITVGGLPSFDEMCQAFFWHYPSEGFQRCDSNINPEDVMRKFGIEEYEWSGSPVDVPKIIKPEELAGKSYVEFMNSLVWSLELKEELQDLLRRGNHSAGCTSGSGPEETSKHANYPDIEIEYTPQDECSATESPTTPTQAPPTTPSEAPPTTPSEAPPTTPSEAPPTTPSEAPPTTASEAPPTTPSEAPPTTPSEAPPTTPSEAPPTTPSEAPPTTPSEAPPTTPSEAPPTTPSEAPPTTPSEAPPTTPSEATPTTPSEAPPTTPSEAPPTTSSDLPTTSTSEAPPTIPPVTSTTEAENNARYTYQAPELLLLTLVTLAAALIQ